MRRALLGLTLLAPLGSLALTACGSPPVQTAADRQGAPVTTTLSGQAVIQSTTRGDLLLFLYDAERPPPPEGTGHPLTFLKLAGSQVFGAALHSNTSAGPFAVDYAFPLVAPGRYLVAATLDSDPCLLDPGPTCRLADFNPFFDVTQQPNGGDLLGGHVDAAGHLLPVVVPEPEGGKLAPVQAVQVAVGKEVPDRPAFQVVTDQATLTLPKDGPLLFKLRVRPIQAGPVDERQPAFLLRYRDDDGDGQPDVDAHGIPQLWPRLFVRKLAEPDPAHPGSLDFLLAAGLRDENDLDANGALDAEDKPLVLLAATWAADPVTNPATIAVPTQLYARLADAQGKPDLSKVVPVTELAALVLPQALDARDPHAPAPLAALPAGRYALIVEQFTGQTWRLPNELQPSVSGRLEVQPGLADQGLLITVGP